MKKIRLLCLVTLFSVLICLSINAAQPQPQPPLWQVYQQSLKGAKYVDLTHAIAPSIPVWSGFGTSKFAPTINPKTSQPYTYQKDGFEATHYDLSTDQLGTQLDPPAHWNPNYPAIDELPATFAVRPLHKTYS
ncbi:MAG: cyclase family protein [Nostocaceae cyanobacterium]|nr:cyclase family protein [Nostocaceae cyanobacterium]